MNARNYKSPAWCMLGMTLLTTQNTWAGPLPLDQLMMWLRDTQTKLAITQKTIVELEAQILVAEKTVATMTTAVRDGKTPDTAMDGDKAGGYELIGRPGIVPVTSTEAKLKESRARLADVRRSLAKAVAERKSLLNDLESIVIQVTAWKEMEGIGVK